jgi:hypothetical protein
MHLFASTSAEQTLEMGKRVVAASASPPYASPQQ